MSTINCPRCRYNFSSDNNFCPNCGMRACETYCRVCGKKIENTNFCPTCGAQVMMNYQQQRPVCDLAFVSMVLGILSIFFGMLTSILAIVFSFISLKKVEKENLDGKTYAYVGMALGSMITFIWLVFIFFFILYYIGYEEATKEYLTLMIQNMN